MPTTFKQWLKENLDEDQRSWLARQGASAGFPGLTYYRDTASLYDKYHDEIWDRLADEAEDMGYENPLAYIGTFNGAQNVWDDIQFKNMMVWAIAESYCREEL